MVGPRGRHRRAGAYRRLGFGSIQGEPLRLGFESGRVGLPVSRVAAVNVVRTRRAY